MIARKVQRRRVFWRALFQPQGCRRFCVGLRQPSRSRHEDLLYSGTVHTFLDGFDVVPFFSSSFGRILHTICFVGFCRRIESLNLTSRRCTIPYHQYSFMVVVERRRKTSQRGRLSQRSSLDIWACQTVQMEKHTIKRASQNHYTARMYF